MQRFTVPFHPLHVHRGAFGGRVLILFATLLQGASALSQSPLPGCLDVQLVSPSLLLAALSLSCPELSQVKPRTKSRTLMGSVVACTVEKEAREVTSQEEPYTTSYVSLLVLYRHLESIPSAWPRLGESPRADRSI